MGSLTAATHTGRLAATVMASSAASTLCRDATADVQQEKTLARVAMHQNV